MVLLARSSIRSLLCLAPLAALSLAACNPTSWTYRAPSAAAASKEDTYEITQEGLQVKVSAKVFGDNLNVIAESTNTNEIPVVMRPDLFRVLDSNGQPLPNGSGHSSCRGHDNKDSVPLAKGETCRIDQGFPVQQGMPSLRSLTVVIEAGVQGGRPLKISIPLERS